MMAVYIAGKRVREDDVEELHLLMLNTSRHLPHHPPDVLDLDVVRATPDLLPALEERVSTLKQFRTELSALDDVEFFMVTENATRVAQRLDELRMKQPKFICLNDDMNKTHHAHTTLAAVQALHSFFTHYFPHPSPFENDPAHPNPFLYLHQWRQVQAQKEHSRQLMLWGGVLGGCAALLLCCVSFLRCWSLPSARWRPLGRPRSVVTGLQQQRDTSPHAHPRTSTIV